MDIISNPHNAFMSSDNLVFLHSNHTVVALAGLGRAEGADAHFRGQVLHSPRDCFHYINENWPGKIDTAMWTFSVFLEEMLLARYTN
ncbi:MAG: hypothetical protein FWC93_03825 [Defluviitaleaceae bacterium]|nr:hypothetical protein [Defluviitaleaceae bacterium]